MGDGHMERQIDYKCLRSKGNEQRHRPEKKALAQEERLVKRRDHRSMSTQE